MAPGLDIVSAAVSASAVNWNLFRYVGDFLHLGGMIFGLSTIVYTRSVEGFSGKTQVMYQLVYFFRYLDVFFETQATYLLFFKITFNLITAAMIAHFFLLRHTYDADVDSCNLLVLIAPALVAAHIFAGGSGFREEMWTFSEFLEPVALLPQYIVCYRGRGVHLTALLYVLAVGGYRLLYVCNWIYKRYKWHGAYHDYTSWIGGVLECIIFVDFVMRILQRREVVEASFLGRFLLNLDDGAGMISEKIEMKAFGRRLPLGVSGTGGSSQEHDTWDMKDKLEEEESTKLMTLDGDVDGYY
eukprot:TRINITY_DN45932_c0_g1_i1.p1 TRINITY_DN45932_c0_g1~~TRINITY_DN45932_c0_g1_i1.p1  ORF type:complete len:299 (+),score=48.26 TRINITY_DN45932_c0_g1_i1:100-996(+)